ncbi:MAG: hypothetical protein LIO45_05620 [Clostridiales bacterium]|nr:hypothetical protein [Clostridiales bacterium]
MKHPIFIRSVSLLLALVMLMAYPASAAEISAQADEVASTSDSSNPFDDSGIQEASDGASDDAASGDDTGEASADSGEETVYINSDGNYNAPEKLVVCVTSYLTEGKNANVNTSYTGIVAFYDYNETDEEKMLNTPYYFYYEKGELQNDEELYISSDRFLNLTSTPTTAAAASISDVDEDAAVYSAEEVYVNYKDEDATEHPDYLFAFNVDGQDNGLYTGYYAVAVAAYDDGEEVTVTDISLTQSSDGTSPTLTWSEISDAESYTVYRMTDSEENWTELASGITDTTYTDTTATAVGTTYSYYVAAVLSDGETSESSAVTYTRYNTPTDVKAANAAGGVKVSWSSVSGATGYQVLRQKSGSSDWTAVGDVDSGETTSYVDSSAVSKTTYLYAVRAYFGDGSSEREDYTVNVWSGASDTASVYYLAAPTLGAHYTDNSGLHIVWSKMTGATGYRVFRRASTSGGWTTIATITSGSTTSYLDTGAKAGDTYYYTVRAYYGSSISASKSYEDGYWSSYYTPDAAVTYYGTPTVTVSAASTGVKVTWTVDSAATGYRIFRKVSGGSWTIVENLTSGTTSSYTDTGATSGKTYYYTVRAYYGSNITGSKSYKDGDWSGYKSSSALYYLATPTMGSIYSTGSGMQVTWSKVSGAVGYRVYRRTSTTGAWKTIASNLTGNSTTSYLDTAAQANVTYYYTVRAYGTDASKTIVWSAYRSSSAVVYHAAPTATVTSVSSGLKVSWTEDSTATGYRIYRKVSGGSWVTVTNITGNSTTSYVDSSSNLTSGKTYYYAVRAYYGTGSPSGSTASNNLWSGYVAASYVYLTTPVIPTTLANNTSSTNGIKVTWEKVSGAAGYYIYRKTSTSAHWSRIATVTSGSTITYLDTSVTSLSAGTTCYYTVRAFDSSKASLSYYNTSGSFCIYLPMPENLTVGQPSSSGTKITWSKETGASSYIVYRRKNSESSWTKLATVTTNSYTDTTITSNKTIYWYCVVPVATATVDGKTVTFRGTYDKTGGTFTLYWSGSERNTWVKKDGKQYYVNSDGTLATGWQYKKRNGSTYKYYFDPASGELVTNLYAYFGKSYRDMKCRIVTCICTKGSTPSYTAIYLYNSDTKAYDIPAAVWKSVGNMSNTTAYSSSVYLAAGSGFRWLTSASSYEQYVVRISGLPSYFHSVLYNKTNVNSLRASSYNSLANNKNNTLSCIRMQCIYAYLILDLTKNGYGKTHRIPVVLYKTSSVSAFGVPCMSKISTSKKYDPTDPAVTGKFFYATSVLGVSSKASSETWVYY